jgi:hypothetical protein
LLGRFTYNPATSHDVWTSELTQRFGPKASEEMAKAYRSASQVVPFVAAAAIGNYNMGSWPEKDMGGLINYYLNLMPYDKARFCGFQEYVDNVLSGRSSGKTNPMDLADRLDKIALETDTALDKARSLIQNGEKEFWATDMDFRILSGMARYYAQKIRAATKLGFFYRTGDISQLRQAIKHGEKALVIWEKLSDRADKIYSSNLVFGPGSIGHWKDNIRFVEDDLKQLKYQEELFQTTHNSDYAFDLGPEPFTHTTALWSTSYTNDYTVEPRFRGVFPSSRFDPADGFGWIEASDLTAPTPESISRYVWSGARKSDDELPSEALLGDFIQGYKEAVFRIDLPEGHYQVTVIVTDRSSHPTDHGPMSVTVVERFGDRPIIDREVIQAGQTVIKRFNINMTGERFSTFRIKFSAEPGADYIVNAMTFTRVEPHIAHVPVRKAKPDRNLDMTVCVTLPPPPNDDHPLTSLGIITSNASTLDIPTEFVRVTLKYITKPGSAYRSLDMQATETSSYSVAIPAEEMKAGDIRYYLEAEDSTGQVVRFPKGKAEQSYFKIDVTDDNTAPVVAHSAIAEHNPDQPLEITAKVTDDSAVSKVLLYYRPTRQTMEYSTISMDRRDDGYIAIIPGRAITQDFDLMYYFEAFDNHGNACLSPDPDKEQPYVVVKVIR